MSQPMIEELRPLFKPESIAVIGASNDPSKWGNWMVTRPIHSGYRGQIYPINPRDKEIFRLKAYPSVLEVPEHVDLAVITIPAKAVPAAMKECVKKGVKAVVLISAGFAETGPKGKALQDEVVGIARDGGIRFMGPNGMGIWSSAVRMNTAFWFTPKSGGISFVSQSGTMGGYLLETAHNKGYGFNSFLSVGNQADLSMAEYVEYLGDDEATSVIVLYIEGLKDGARFLKKAKEVIRKKPIIVYKAGRTENGARATMSHTASLSGADEVFEAICRQAGIIRTYDVIPAFDAAEALDHLGRRRPLRGHHGLLLRSRSRGSGTGLRDRAKHREISFATRTAANQPHRSCGGSASHDHRQHHRDPGRQSSHRRHHHHGADLDQVDQPGFCQGSALGRRDYLGTAKKTRQTHYRHGHAGRHARRRLRVDEGTRHPLLRVPGGSRPRHVRPVPLLIGSLIPKAIIIR
jgi:succinyl-CoA synthetase alpha subunit